MNQKDTNASSTEGGRPGGRARSLGPVRVARAVPPASLGFPGLPRAPRPDRSSSAPGAPMRLRPRRMRVRHGGGRPRPAAPRGGFGPPSAPWPWRDSVLPAGILGEPSDGGIDLLWSVLVLLPGVGLIVFAVVGSDRCFGGAVVDLTGLHVGGPTLAWPRSPSSPFVPGDGSSWPTRSCPNASGRGPVPGRTGSAGLFRCRGRDLAGPLPAARGGGRLALRGDLARGRGRWGRPRERALHCSGGRRLAARARARREARGPDGPAPSRARPADSAHRLSPGPASGAMRRSARGRRPPRRRTGWTAPRGASRRAPGRRSWRGSRRRRRPCGC
mgnify:CR=1 FL=1